MQNAIFNWSGGKDSALTLYHLLQGKEYNVRWLLTSMSSEYRRISMHGVREELLVKQAESIGIPLHKLIVPTMPSMETYNNLFRDTLNEFRREGIEYSVFGDIFLEDLRVYREKQLAKVKMKGVFPIWKQPTDRLVREFIDLGFKAVIVCVSDRYLDKSFAGRIIDADFLKDLPKDVDPCGENGEFHSFVYEGPIFKKPIAIKIGEVIHKKYEPPPKDKEPSNDTYAPSCPFEAGFWYCDLIPAEK